MVVAVKEGCERIQVSRRLSCGGQCLRRENVLRGFFFRNRKQVSKSSRYLVR